MAENYSNGAQTTLNGAINNSQTTATLTSASGWPAAPFRALISGEGGNTDELIYVGARSGTALSSITRAAEAIADGTQSAQAHSSGALITQVYTAEAVPAFSYKGYNTIGASTEAVSGSTAYAKQVTFATDGLITGLGLYLDHTSDTVAGSPLTGVWEDSANTLGTLIAQKNASVSDTFYLGSSTISWPARWIEVPLTFYVTAGTYWVGFLFGDIGSLRIYYDGSGTDRTFVSGGVWLANGARYTQTNTTRKYSMRVGFIKLV